MINIDDAERIRLITFDRPEALNAFNSALYDASTGALTEAADDPGIAVVVITGTGRAFSSGVDVLEMAGFASGELTEGKDAFPRFIDTLQAFPKPVVCAVNGLALGVGATMLALVDLVFMARDARVRCPFTALAVAPEAGSSFTYPMLMGRQRASWALMSSEWLSADDCREAGLAWKICEPDRLLEETLAHARILAGKPISSLIETKRTIVAGLLDSINAARERESAAFARLLGQPANIEAMTAFAEKREPNFATVDAKQRDRPAQ
jgi:enoyl-CoA hydratase/carnithine racemase